MDFAYLLPWTDEQYVEADGGLVNLLTREEKEHVINTKDWCGPGGPAWQASHLSPDGVESVPEHKVWESGDCSAGTGVGAWKQNGRYLVPGSGRRVYRLP